MSIPKIPESEYRFCLIMWEQEPVAATDMVKLCHREAMGQKSHRAPLIHHQAPAR